MDAIDKFNKVMDAFNEAFSEAKTDKERIKIEKKYSKLIDKAERELEKNIEDKIEKDVDFLIKEHKESELKLIELEKLDKRKTKLKEKKEDGE